MIAVPIVVHVNAPRSHSVATAVFFSAGFAAMYVAYSTALDATLVSW